MKKVIFTLLFLVLNFALAWAGDEPATSNPTERPSTWFNPTRITSGP